MASPRTKRLIGGLIILAVACLVIKGLLLLWNIAVILIVIALLGAAGFVGFRAWQRQQARAGGTP